MALATKFGRGVSSIKGDSPICNEQLMAVAPSIFAQEPHSSRSARYTYIPTIDVLNGLRKEGFEPFFAAQAKSRIEGKTEFTKHMLRLRHVNDIAKTEVNEIILVNSHDGTSSYQMIAGMFRFVCTNGMVCGDTINDIRVPHKGNITDNVIDAAYTIVDDFDNANQSMETMKSIELTGDEQEIFARASLALKYEENAPIDSRKLLTPKRWQDDKDDSVWSNFNRIQENLIRGGQRGFNASGNRTTTREVKSIDTNIKLNKALWILADEMARLKR